jgi:hypothetical protein
MILLTQNEKKIFSHEKNKLLYMNFAITLLDEQKCVPQV